MVHLLLPVWDLHLYVVRVIGLARLICAIIVHDISNQVLQRFEPHAQNGAQLAESVDVARVIDQVFLAQVPGKLLGEVVAILCEGIVVATVPEITKVVDDLVHIIAGIVSEPDRQALLQHESS